MNNNLFSAPRVRIELRPYTPKELCKLYRVSRKTFLKWIKPIQPKLGERIGHFYSIPQVRIIFGHLELPDILDMD